MGVKQVISGGQTGADRGGLEAGRELGLKTGGYAPKGYLTERGPDPSLADFGLVETDSAEYPPRTRMNVEASDGTVLFGNPKSRGSRLTQALCDELGKPLLSIEMVEIWWPETERGFRAWLRERGIAVLNVAGNRESVSPGIGDMVREFLVEAEIGDE